MKSIVTSSSSSETRARAHTDRSSFLLFNQTERGVDSNSREKHPCTALLRQRRRRRGRRTFFGVCVEIDFLKSDSHHGLRRSGKTRPFTFKSTRLKDGGHIDTRTTTTTTTTDELSRDFEEQSAAAKRNRYAFMREYLTSVCTFSFLLPENPIGWIV